MELWVELKFFVVFSSQPLFAIREPFAYPYVDAQNPALFLDVRCTLQID
jgi:hypothetical protein